MELFGAAWLVRHGGAGPGGEQSGTVRIGQAG